MSTTKPDSTARMFVGNLSVDDPAEPFLRRSWRYSVRRNLRRAREIVGDDPILLPLVLRATPTGTIRRLSDATQLVIEGFPRSGNTFAFFAIKHAERLAGRDIVLSSHVHTPSAVKAAVRSRFPTVFVVRQPLDTIVSLLIAVPHVPFGEAIDEWRHHHREILPYHERFVVATFDQVTKDFGTVTSRVNERFGTSFACYQATPANDEAVFAAIDENHTRLHGGTENVVPRPSELRRGEKEWLLAQLDAPEFRGRLDDSKALYGELAAMASPVDS